MDHPSHHAKANPDKPAYVMAATGQTLTYGQLDARSNRGAHFFRSIGLKPGDHVAILIENALAFMEIVWAAQRSGLYYTAISTHLSPADAAYIVDDCGAKLFVASAATRDIATEVAGLLKNGAALFMCGGVAAPFKSWEDALAGLPQTPVADEVCGYDMLYSSGTTGRPKGVKPQFVDEPLGSINPLLRLLTQKMCGMNADSVYLSPAPLYHAAPLRFNMMSAAFGGTSIIMEKFDPEQYLALVERHRVTQTQLVPTMFVRMLKLPDAIRLNYDVSSLKGAIHAAAPCPIDVKAAMIDWWGPILIEYYGATEGNGVTIINSTEWLSHRGSVGRTLIGELKIVDDDGAVLPIGETGAVYFSGARPFTYHNDPDKTKSAYNDQGWSTLGDIGRLDDEGYLYLTDRKAFMIISGGVNIYPQEAENVLINHPAIADVAVFGVPDAEMGEAVKAVVELQDQGRAGPAMAAEILAWCRDRLSSIKCPRSIDFTEALPRTPTGKLMKRLLRDQYWQGQTLTR